MKNLLILILLLTPSLCKADYWTRKADFPGGARLGAYSFTIGNLAYVGGGYNFDNTVTYNDLWAYDPVTNSWTQKTNLPAHNKAYAGCFAIGNKGYVCSGIDSYLLGATNTLYEYDPILNIWNQKSDFPGIARAYPTAFVINNLGYLGIGYHYVSSEVLLNDFYSFNPTTNSWSSTAPIPSTGYEDGVAFVISNKAYVTGLYSANKVPIDTLWQYDPVANSWAAKSNFPDTPRCDAAAFTLNGMGYFGTGDKADTGASKLCNDFWQYNPVTDIWTQKASLPSTRRDETAYFTINGKGYICFGGENPNVELWEYTPDSISDVQELSIQPLQTKASPNPFSITTTINFGKELHYAEIILTDICGKEIATYKNINGTEFLLHRNSLALGMYFYRLIENGLIIAKDKIVVQ